MEIHQLQCFLAVVKEGGFNRATGRLHISQPALSYQIKRLEQDLGVPLFHRRPGGVNPTEAGRILYQYAQKVIDTVKQARSAIEEQVDGVVGEIRIGTTNSTGIYFLPQALWSMRKKYPAARSFVVYRDSDDVLDLLRANKLDLALVASPRPDRRLHQEILFEEKVSLVCGKSHPMFGKGAVDVKDLNDLQFIALSEKNPTGLLVRDYLAGLGVSIEPVIATDNVETLKKMVEAGLGVAFLPEMVINGNISGLNGASERFSRLNVGPPLYRQITIVTLSNLEISRVAEAFLQELRANASQWKASITLNFSGTFPITPRELEGRLEPLL